MIDLGYVDEVKIAQMVCMCGYGITVSIPTRLE